MNPDALDHTVVNDSRQDGVVHLHDHTEDSIGLDVATLKLDRGNLSNPFFGNDMERDAAHRDFMFNSLYDDRRNRVLVGPSGNGLREASPA